MRRCAPRSIPVHLFEQEETSSSLYFFFTFQNSISRFLRVHTFSISNSFLDFIFQIQSLFDFRFTIYDLQIHDVTDSRFTMVHCRYTSYTLEVSLNTRGAQEILTCAVRDTHSRGRRRAVRRCAPRILGPMCVCYIFFSLHR